MPHHDPAVGAKARLHTERVFEEEEEEEEQQQY